MAPKSTNYYATIENRLSGGQQQRDLLQLLCESPPLDRTVLNGIPQISSDPPYIRNAVRLLSQVDQMLAEHAAWPPIPEAYLKKTNNNRPSLEHNLFAMQQGMNCNDVAPAGRITKSNPWLCKINQNYYVKHLVLSLANLLFVCVMAVADCVQLMRIKTDVAMDKMCRQLRLEYERNSMPSIALRSPAVLGLCLVNGFLKIIDILLGGLMKILLPHTGYKI